MLKIRNFGQKSVISSNGASNIKKMARNAVLRKKKKY